MKKFILGMALCGWAIVSCSDQPQKAEYAGEDLTGKVEIKRDQQTKTASIRINVPGAWKVYAGPGIEQIDFSVPVAEGKNPGGFSLDVPDSVRSYFQVILPEGKAILAERHLPMAGGFNFRDLGGYRTTDGRYVKWGKILRSDDLYHLTQADLEYLGSVPLRTVVDFRSPEEIETAPDKIPAGVTRFAYSISPGNLMGAVTDFDSAEVDEEKVNALMVQLNEIMVSDSASIDQYRKFFALLQDDTHVPLMFHCSAGKDRTGMGAMFVLSALGVPEETIMQDYLLSNEYLKEKYAPYIAERPQLASLFGVKAEFLQAGIDRIKRDHGSVENYLRNVLNVDIEKMREMYLY